MADRARNDWNRMKQVFLRKYWIGIHESLKNYINVCLLLFCFSFSTSIYMDNAYAVLYSYSVCITNEYRTIWSDVWCNDYDTIEIRLVWLIMAIIILFFTQISYIWLSCVQEHVMTFSILILIHDDDDSTSVKNIIMGLIQFSENQHHNYICYCRCSSSWTYM